jgi:hypothetical protein
MAARHLDNSSLVRHRDFMLLWSGQTVSEVGSQVTVLALPLVAIVILSASTFEVGLLSATVTSAYLLIPLARSGWWVLLFAVGWISWTFGSTLCGIALVSYQQSTWPPGLRGRVSATTRWINWGTLPLGGLVGGALGTALGVQAMLWVAVIGGCSSGLWLYFSPLRGMRDIPTAGARSGR